ncbi:MAG: hypothetical protein NTY05_05955 [Rhodocyclales bacterium]|nr:hypothetical protein [Rhodocyclales bacterium]
MSTIRLLRVLIAATALVFGPAHAADGRAEVSRHALAAPPAAEQSIAGLAAYLAPSSYSPADKAWSIFIWIGDRISYDVDAYLKGEVRDTKVTAEGVLQRRATVCDGFAAVFSALARSAGLEVIIVEGYAKAYGVPEYTVFNTTNHAWNLIMLDGKWQVIDPTWGAGYVFQDRYNKLLDTVYFLGQSEELKFTHWPVDPKWRQVMGLSLTKGQFETQPNVDPGLFRAGVRGNAISAAIAEPGYAGLVTVFEQNHRGLRVQSIPLSQRLRAGQPYRFRIQAEAFEEIVVMNGSGAVPLAGSNGAVDGEFRPAHGSMLVAGRPKEGGRLTGLFQYTVE